MKLTFEIEIEEEQAFGPVMCLRVTDGERETDYYGDSATDCLLQLGDDFDAGCIFGPRD